MMFSSKMIYPTAIRNRQCIIIILVLIIWLLVFKKLNNATGFNYVYDAKEICSNTNKSFVNVIIVIFSEEKDNRLRLRNNLSGQIAELSDDLQEKYRVEFVFMTGLSGSSTLVQNEYNQYRDIVQGYFQDTYRNLPNKGMFTLNWINRYCGNFTFWLKMDSDVKLSLGKLLRKGFPKPGAWMAGRVLKNTRPVRNSGTHIDVKPGEYNRTFYPDYLDGFAYISPILNSKYLLQGCFETDVFFIHDVYETGLCREKTSIRLIDMKHFCRARDDSGCFVIHYI